MDLNDITITNRRGMTVLPDDIDEATGERIPNTAVVKDTQFGNWEEEEEYFEEYFEEYEAEADQYALSPEDQDPDYEVRLAETFSEINTTEFEVSPTLAYEIASADIGNSRADAAVQLFTSQVYNGELTAEEAFQSAVETGIDPVDLLDSFYKLQEVFN